MCSKLENLQKKKFFPNDIKTEVLGLILGVEFEYGHENFRKLSGKTLKHKTCANHYFSNTFTTSKIANFRHKTGTAGSNSVLGHNST